jgi:hypothetical protein
MNFAFALRPARHLASLALFYSLAAIGLQANPITYSFTGDCIDCAGTATATLVLDNYTPGTAIDLMTTTLVSFTYDGTNLLPSYTILPGNLVDMSGTLPAGSGPADFYITSIFNTMTLNLNGINIVLDGNFFSSSSSSGNWSTGDARTVLDFGSNGNFALAGVPEPSSVLLIGAGLAGLAAFGRRKR